ncbi:DNA methylase [Barrientosiimonas humi]|uniref:Methyltransferase n=2 Tax=Barrientosiimonas TaxID=1535207 RepID=A0A542XB36_9MICO|nr:MULTISPECIES: DNA methyltransferase [Barrientosiimonas]TQL33040.1 DNA methylase [Barrientosiimonas humi]BDZ57905.1 hypothetical protein GCM10025872_15620 [Barrientosiimonas endolithica]CAG7573030.1 hypothetical protein BH39T_PBIAJDOK_01655 [Barrientosiimonas humi]
MNSESDDGQVRGPALPLRPYVLASSADLAAERAVGADEDVHFTASLARSVIEDLTVAGDRVLDPFAGFGTTLRVATELGRSAVGVELLPERCTVARAAAPSATVVEGDARGLDRLVSGPFDLVLTSPPYRTERDHPADPLSAYARDRGDYPTYLRELTGVVAACVDLLADGGHVVLNVANIAAHQGFTPLAWDLGRAVTSVARVVQDVPVCWDALPHDLASDHLIVLARS